MPKEKICKECGESYENWREHSRIRGGSSAGYGGRSYANACGLAGGKRAADTRAEVNDNRKVIVRAEMHKRKAAGPMVTKYSPERMGSAMTMVYVSLSEVLTFQVSAGEVMIPTADARIYLDFLDGEIERIQELLRVAIIDAHETGRTATKADYNTMWAAGDDVGTYEAAVAYNEGISDRRAAAYVNRA